MDSNNKRILEVELPFQAKTYDIDFGGVVSNIVYLRWFEDLRFRIMEVADCPLDEFLADGIAPVLLNTNIEYKKPIRIGEKPVGKMWIKKMTKLKWYLEAEIVINEKIATQGEQIGIFVKTSTGYPTAIPEKLYHKYLSDLDRKQNSTNS